MSIDTLNGFLKKLSQPIDRLAEKVTPNYKETLGNLYQGNNLSILKEFPDTCIDLIITDPPYGINYKSSSQNYSKRNGEKGTHSKVRNEEYFSEIKGDSEFPVKWLEDAYRIMRDGSAIYIFNHWKSWSILEQAVIDVGFKIKNMIVVNKSNWGMGDLKGTYAPKHELLMFATKGRHILNERVADVWEMPIMYSGAKRHHPNEKHLQWIVRPIINSSKPKQVVLDPFMGSGTTCVASKNLQRLFVGIELDKKYFEIAKHRVKTSKMHPDALSEK